MPGWRDDRGIDSIDTLEALIRSEIKALAPPGARRAIAKFADRALASILPRGDGDVVDDWLPGMPVPCRDWPSSVAAGASGSTGPRVVRSSPLRCRRGGGQPSGEGRKLGGPVLAENVIRPGRRPVSGLVVVGLVARVSALA